MKDFRVTVIGSASFSLDLEVRARDEMEAMQKAQAQAMALRSGGQIDELGPLAFEVTDAAAVKVDEDV